MWSSGTVGSMPGEELQSTYKVRCQPISVAALILFAVGLPIICFTAWDEHPTISVVMALLVGWIVWVWMTIHFAGFEVKVTEEDLLIRRYFFWESRQRWVDVVEMICRPGELVLRFLDGSKVRLGAELVHGEKAIEIAMAKVPESAELTVKSI